MLEGGRTLEADMYTLFFKNPDDALLFDKWLNKKCGMNVEKSALESKKNYSFFEHLSQLLSFALIGFSIVSIIFFVINLLLSHINNNKRNLGTLKAFGLANKNIITLYSSITLLLVSISFISAFLLSGFLGQILLDGYVNLKNINSENYMTNVTFMNRDFWNTFILFVLIPTIVIVARLFTYLYRVTPGDLIYERK